MTPQPIRAIYHAGNLRLLDPVNLREGEEVSLVIQSEEERVRAALSGLVAEPSGVTSVEVNIDELMRSIAEAFAGQPPLSETIIEERRSGP